MSRLKKALWGDTDKAADDFPFIIAEMSGNHNASLKRALAIVDAAAECGADAVKMQTYTADTMTLDLSGEEFVIDNPASPWYGRALYDLYREAHTPWEWHAPIMARARERGLLCFSSAFDESAIAFLSELDAPCYKISSFELVDLPLIQAAAATGKPLILSTGMASLAEIAEAVDAARGAGCRTLVLLQCTSSYPASPADSNLCTIPHMAELFRCDVGLSDHTLGIGVAVAATALGATVIEKHLTLSRSDGGVDAAFSLEPAEFASLVAETKRARLALGSVRYGATASEQSGRQRRRSLYIAQDMDAGAVFTPDNLRRVRPGRGLHPRYYELLLGRSVRRAVTKGTPLSWGLVGDLRGQIGAKEKA